MKIIKAKQRRDTKWSVTLLFAGGITLRKVVPNDEFLRWVQRAKEDAAAAQTGGGR